MATGWVRLNSNTGSAGPPGPPGAGGPLTIVFTGAGGQVGVPYQASLIATGGAPPYTYAISTGTLQAGLILNASTGAIAGTPTATGTSTFVGQVTDSASTVATTTSIAIVVANASVAPAPIVTSVTGLTVDTEILGNGTGYTFHGTINLPSTWAQIQAIQINVITPGGQRVYIGEYLNPSSATIPFQGYFSYGCLLSTSAQTVSVEFVTYN